MQSIVDMPVADRLKAADLWNEASMKLQQILNEDSTAASNNTTQEENSGKVLYYSVNHVLMI